MWSVEYKVSSVEYKVSRVKRQNEHLARDFQQFEDFDASKNKSFAASHIDTLTPQESHRLKRGDVEA